LGLGSPLSRPVSVGALASHWLLPLICVPDWARLRRNALRGAEGLVLPVHLCFPAPFLSRVQIMSFLNIDLRYYVPLRLPVVRFASLHLSLDSRYLGASSGLSSLWARFCTERLRNAGDLLSRFPLLFRQFSQGDNWPSRVPVLSLWWHALVSDSGGVPAARHNASRTAAFRHPEGVGFSSEEDIL